MLSKESKEQNEFKKNLLTDDVETTAVCCLNMLFVQNIFRFEFHLEFSDCWYQKSLKDEHERHPAVLRLRPLFVPFLILRRGIR